MRYMSLLNRAKREAIKSQHTHRVGACLYKGGSIIAVGYNQVRLKRTGLSYTNYVESLHAERDACSKVAKEKLRGSTICVVRINNKGKFLFAKPCKDCLALLTMLGIRKVIYTTDCSFKEMLIADYK